MADEKAESFMRSFLGKVIESFSISKQLNLHITPEWVEENRWVPPDFIYEMLNFTKPFTDGLTDYVLRLPAMLYASEDFFKRFTNSVCLKLIEGEDDQTAFLKVTAFILTLTISAFVFDCYRVIYELPSLYHRMLKNHLRTRFYIEDKFEDMVLKSRELRGNLEWISQTWGQMWVFMELARIKELLAPIIYDDSFKQKIFRLTLADIRKPIIENFGSREQRSNKSDSERVRCKYCNLNCISALDLFFLPRIKRKPDVSQENHDITITGDSGFYLHKM